MLVPASILQPSGMNMNCTHPHTLGCAPEVWPEGQRRDERYERRGCVAAVCWRQPDDDERLAQQHHLPQLPQAGQVRLEGGEQVDLAGAKEQDSTQGEACVVSCSHKRP